jgi:thiol-disulfide isomerase/thioredoxin
MTSEFVRNFSKLALFACLTVVSAVAGESATGGPPPLPGSIGQPLPHTALPDLEGKQVWLDSAYAGKVVVVDFWAAWCVTCRKGIPLLSELQAKHGAAGLQVVGISIDEKGADFVAKQRKKLKVDYTVLLDPKNSLAPVFGFTSIPQLYLFDRQGKLVWQVAGFDSAKEKEMEAKVLELLAKK